MHVLCRDWPLSIRQLKHLVHIAPTHPDLSSVHVLNELLHFPQIQPECSSSSSSPPGWRTAPQISWKVTERINQLQQPAQNSKTGLLASSPELQNHFTVQVLLHMLVLLPGQLQTISLQH